MTLFSFTLGNTVFSGSCRSSGSSWLRAKTSLPRKQDFQLISLKKYFYFTISCEDSTKEEIKEENLTNHIEKVEELTKCKLKVIHIKLS